MIGLRGMVRFVVSVRDENVHPVIVAANSGWYRSLSCGSVSQLAAVIDPPTPHAAIFLQGDAMSRASPDENPLGSFLNGDLHDRHRVVDRLDRTAQIETTGHDGTT